MWVFDEFPEAPEENWTITEETLKKVLTEKLKILHNKNLKLRWIAALGNQEGALGQSEARGCKTTEIERSSNDSPTSQTSQGKRSSIHEKNCFEF